MDTIDRNNAYTVTSLDDLAKIYANPLPHIATKETDHITEVGRAFIAASPFLVLATSNGTSIDCSPKGDAPGFVQLRDDRTLLIPDRPGNNRIDGMKNLLVNPKVGIIFMVPGSNETYRVTGSATISTDPELLRRFDVRGKPPARGRGRRCRRGLQSLSQSLRAGEAVGCDGAAEQRAEPRRLRRRPRRQRCCLRQEL